LPQRRARWKIAGIGRRERQKELTQMAKTVPMIGLDSAEIYWIRLLISLLRHPDPGVPELAHQALLYLTESCCRPANPPSQTANRTG